MFRARGIFSSAIIYEFCTAYPEREAGSRKTPQAPFNKPPLGKEYFLRAIRSNLLLILQV